MFKSDLLVRLVDNDHGTWRVAAPLIYEGHSQTFEVPVGTMTDFASVPAFVRWAVSPIGKHVRSAVLHDWLYSPECTVSRRDADRIFYRAMKADGVSWWRRHAIYRGVRAFGSAFYHEPFPTA